METIQVYFKCRSPIQFDIDDVKYKRSCKGALHIRPNTIREITSDELEYLKSYDPGWAKLNIIIMPEKKATSKPKPKLEPVTIPMSKKTSKRSKKSFSSENQE